MNKNTFTDITVCIIFCLLIISNLIIFSNLHLHFLTGELFIIHGHPLSENGSKSSPINSHQHSPIEHFVISSLFDNRELITLLFVILVFLQLLYYTSQYNDEIIQKKLFFSIPTLRAPPLP